VTRFPPLTSFPIPSPSPGPGTCTGTLLQAPALGAGRRQDMESDTGGSCTLIESSLSALCPQAMAGH
jgi:hypothetical protein